MSLGFHIYPDLRLLFIRGQGVITQVERVKTMIAWLHEPDYMTCVDALFDVTDAESTPKVSELRELLAIFRRYRPQSPDGGPRKLAIVTSRPITFAVARVFGQLMHLEDNPLQVKVFLDREAAWEWLRPGEPLVGQQ